MASLSDELDALAGKQPVEPVPSAPKKALAANTGNLSSELDALAPATERANTTTGISAELDQLKKPEVPPQEALNEQGVVEAQKLKGTPVAPGMPTSTEQMGSAQPLKGLAGIGEAAAALITGMASLPIQAGATGEFASRHSPETLQKIASYKKGKSKELLLQAAERERAEAGKGVFARGEEVGNQFQYQPRTEEGRKAATATSQILAAPLTAAEGVLMSPYALTKSLEEFEKTHDPKAAALAGWHSLNLDNAIDNSPLSDNGKAAARLLKAAIEIPVGGELYYRGGLHIAMKMEMKRPPLMRSDPVGDITIGELTDRLARGDTSVFPDLVQGIKEYGAPAMTDVVFNKALASARVGGTRTALAQIEKGLRTILSKSTPELELDQKAKETLGTIRDSLTYTEQHTDEIASRAAELATLPKKIKAGEAKAPTMKEAVGNWLDEIKTGAAFNYKAKSDIEKEALRNGWDKTDRSAMVDWMQGMYGQDGLLAQLRGRQPSSDEVKDFFMRRANTTLDKSMKASYERAAELPEDLKSATMQIHEHLDKQWEAMNKSGLMEGYLQYYVRQVWEKDPKTAQRFLNLIKGAKDSGILQTNPGFLRERVYESYYRGEMMGLKARDKDLFNLTANWDNAALHALADRNFVQRLSSVVMPDGKPLVTFVNPRPLSPDETTLKLGSPAAMRVLAPPTVDPESAAFYVHMDHPAFKSWIVRLDAEDKPRYYEADLRVHPDGIDTFKQLFDKSELEHVGLETALRFSSYIKGSALVGPFHLVNIDFHTIERMGLFNYLRDPLRKQTVQQMLADPRYGPLLHEGMQHGLNLFADSAMQRYGEGLVSGGIWRHVPGVGKMLNEIGDYTFNVSIPRMAAMSYLHELEKDMARYSKPTHNLDLNIRNMFGLKESRPLTHEEIAEVAARNVNDAMGFQNEQWMALKGKQLGMLLHSKSWLDMERFVMLAPEFLKSRVKFVGRAMFDPYALAQRTALIRGAAYLWLSSRLLNVMLSDDNSPHLDIPFGVKVGNWVYSLRSINGDIFRLYEDWRSFIWDRLNPATVKPAMEMLSRANPATGRPRSFEDQIRDTFTNSAPRVVTAPLTFNPTDEKMMHATLRGLLQAFAVSSYEYKTDARKLIDKYYFQTLRGLPIDAQSKAILEAKREAYEAVSEGVGTNEVAEIFKKHGIDPRPDIVMDAVQKGQMPLEDRRFAALEGPAVMEVWNKMTPEEKEHFKMQAISKIMNSKWIPQEKKRQFMNEVQ